MDQETQNAIIAMLVDIKAVMYFQMIVATNPGKYHFESNQDVEKAFSIFVDISLKNIKPPKNEGPVIVV